jgi:hypothetical protein
MNWTTVMVTAGVLGVCFTLVALAGHVERRRLEPARPQRHRGRHAPGREARPARAVRGEDGQGGVVAALVVDPLTEAELLAARADHGAESLAVNTGMWRETQDDQAAAIWRAGFDWYTDKIGKDADALVASTEAIGAGALDDFDVEMAAYDEKIKMIIERFVHGEPEPALAVVSTAVETSGTVFTWSTGSYPVVLSVPPAPVRELYADRIAADPAPREAPAERFYAVAGFVS